MKTIKMSLANMQGKMSREEMKSIMAGSGSGLCDRNPGWKKCSVQSDCGGKICIHSGLSSCCW